MKYLKIVAALLFAVWAIGLTWHVYNLTSVVIQLDGALYQVIMWAKQLQIALTQQVV